MSINVCWINPEQSAVLMSFEAQWTWEMFYVAIDAALVLFDSITEPVPLVIDLSNSSTMPSGSIAHIRNAQGIKHPQMESVIFVGMSTFMRMIGNLAMRLNRGKTREVFILATMDEALQHIPITNEFIQP